ncbi:HRDC-like protein [Infundibulicybe gibba]|nr:HRDC-like protein [Infundibulicybe gibba]
MEYLQHSKVVSPRAALLSNYEVLTLLRELESDHLERTKTALRIKKEEVVPSAETVPASIPGGHDPLVIEISENLRTVEVEAIQYLSADYLPTSTQTPTGITSLVKSLSPYKLTKAEKLQVVNLSPTLPVELYVIVEELEDRLGDRMDEILAHVKASVGHPSKTTTNGAPTTASAIGDIIIGEVDQQWEGLDPEFYEEDILFDDTGEGAGVEGDLDLDDD